MSDDLSGPISLFTLLLLVGIVLLAIIYRGTTLGSGKGARRYKRLEDLARDVTRLTGLAAGGTYVPRLDGLTFQGSLAKGRAARIQFESVSVGSSTTTYVHLSVEADDAPDLTISLETLGTRLGKAVGLKREIEVGHTEFDARFFLETADPKRARAALARNGDLRAAIDSVFNFGRSPKVTLQKGRFTYTSEVTNTNPDEYSRILMALDRMAAQFDRVPLKIKRFDSAKRAQVDTSGRTRCPYCRDAIRGDEETLTACQKCSTVVHEACWNEHGGCPVFGCSQKQGESRRVRVT